MKYIIELRQGVQLNNQNFFGEISRILFALFVHRRLCFAMFVRRNSTFDAVFFFGVVPFRK